MKNQLPEISGLDLVVIIGLPATGKTTLAEKIKGVHHIIHTDDYIAEGYEKALYVMMDDIQKIKRPILVEGVLGYRLLRKMEELKWKAPDLIIECIATTETRVERYMQRGKALPSKFDSNLTKIWGQYKYTANPKVITYHS